MHSKFKVGRLYTPYIGRVIEYSDTTFVQTRQDIAPYVRTQSPLSPGVNRGEKFPKKNIN